MISLVDLILAKKIHGGGGGEGKTYNDGYNDGHEAGYTDGHEAGYSEGHEVGYTEGQEQGKVDEWDTFWDVYQDFGNRKNYTHGFAGKGWNDTTFKPKYDIVPRSTTSSVFANSLITNLKQILIDCGISLDMSKISYSASFFASSSITHIPDITLNHQPQRLFEECTQLVTIDRIKINVSSGVVLDNWFTNASSLQNLIIEGKIIGTTVVKSIICSSSPLTAESAKSIISCLNNYTGTEDEFKYSIYFSPTTWSYLDAEGDTASPNGNSWQQYIQDLGWNI